MLLLPKKKLFKSSLLCLAVSLSSNAMYQQNQFTSQQATQQAEESSSSACENNQAEQKGDFCTSQDVGTQQQAVRLAVDDSSTTSESADAAADSFDSTSSSAEEGNHTGHKLFGVAKSSLVDVAISAGSLRQERKAAKAAMVARLNFATQDVNGHVFTNYELNKINSRFINFAGTELRGSYFDSNHGLTYVSLRDAKTYSDTAFIGYFSKKTFRDARYIDSCGNELLIDKSHAKRIHKRYGKQFRNKTTMSEILARVPSKVNKHSNHSRRSRIARKLVKAPSAQQQH